MNSIPDSGVQNGSVVHLIHYSTGTGGTFSASMMKFYLHAYLNLHSVMLRIEPLIKLAMYEERTV